MVGCLHGSDGTGDLRNRALISGTLMWRDLKWVLLGAVGQGYIVWKSIELTYIPQEESLSSGKGERGEA